MHYEPVIDDDTKVQKMQKDGVTPLFSMYIGIAVPKTAGVDWKQTEWGQVIVREALSGFPAGEHQTASFAWKVVDGDSTVPNKNMVVPNSKEGYPGHWVLNCSTSLPVKCYLNGKYGPMDLVQDKSAIKTGDYCRVLITVKPNGAKAPNTPGVYLNPFGFEMTRAGAEIISGPDVGAMFEQAGAGIVPPNAQVDPSVAAPQNQQQPPNTPTGPDMGFLNAAPEVKYIHSTGTFTKAECLAKGWTEAQIATLPTDPPAGTGEEVPF